MVGIILGLIGFVGFISFISFSQKHLNDDDSAIFHRFSIPFTLVLLYWFASSATAPYALNSIVEEKLAVEMKNGTQIVTFKNINSPGNFITKNLNLKFGKVIDEDKDIIILENYPAGWYGGIYWEGKQILVLKEKNDTFGNI